jgi:hypothetical protein
MGFTQTRNIEDLNRFESIRGEKIPPEDIAYIAKFAKANSVISVEFPTCPADFSMPMYFFRNNELKLVFIKNGKEARFCNLTVDSQSFVAFKVKKQKMYVYGYFPHEFD